MSQAQLQSACKTEPSTGATTPALANLPKAWSTTRQADFITCHQLVNLAKGQHTHTEAMHVTEHHSQNIHKHVQVSAFGLRSMMLRRVIVKTVEFVDLIEMRKTDSSEETTHVPHVPSSS